MPPVFDIFTDCEALASALAIRVAAIAAEAAAARGAFRIAIPGGSVVAFLARGLAQVKLEPAAWHVFWADERCVPLADPRSNARLAQVELLDRLRIPPARQHVIEGSLGPEAAAAAYEEDLKTAFGARGLPVFDLVLLGLGEDGHIASLFPGHPALAETTRWAAPVWDAPKPPPERVTLTLPVLNQARHILVAAAGDGKAAAAAQCCAPPAADAAPLPARRLAPAAGELRWLLDRAAAAQLQETP